MKKAETNLLWMIIGIVVAILILFPLFNISKAFFAKQDNTIENFNNLINKINSLNANEETSTLFVFGDKYFLIGFKKDESFIENKDCGDFKFNERVNKPEICSNNACLCLCIGKSISSNLCANENDLCMPFNNVDIIDNQNACNYFVLNKDSNLLIKKQYDLIIINKEKETSSGNLNKKIIVIDPGHGGDEPGAVAIDGTYEKDYALEYSKILKDKINIYYPEQFEVYLTREEDILLSLQERVNVAAEKNADLFISLHFNSLEDKSAKGAEILYCDKEDNANCNNFKDCASSCASSILSKLSPSLFDISREGVMPGNDFWVLKGKRPSLLLELGFLSNEEDLNKIKNSKYEIIDSLIAPIVSDCFESSACQIS